VWCGGEEAGSAEAIQGLTSTLGRAGDGQRKVLCQRVVGAAQGWAGAVDIGAQACTSTAAEAAQGLGRQETQRALQAAATRRGTGVDLKHPRLQPRSTSKQRAAPPALLRTLKALTACGCVAVTTSVQLLAAGAASGAHIPGGRAARLGQRPVR